MATGIDLHTRHGAIMACAEIIHALHKVGLDTNRLVVNETEIKVLHNFRNTHDMQYAC